MSDTHLDFHPLTFVADHDGVMVGRPDIESYAVLPADGAELLRRLVDGMSQVDAAAWYEKTFGESLDMADFVESLQDLGFVRISGEKAIAPQRVRFQSLGRLAFSPMAWVCYAALLVGSVIAMVEQPQVRPAAANVFFSPSLILVQVLLTAVQLPALLWHEWFHVLAGLRRGLPSRLGIGRRLYFFVIQTHLNGLLSIPKRERYLAFLSGIVADVVMFSALTLVAVVDLDDQQLSGTGRFALAVAYTTLLRIAWQFLIFLRTDLYYVVTTAMGCAALHEATADYLRKRFAWLPGVHPSTSDRREWTPRDAAMAPWFAVLTVIGAGLLLAVAVVGLVPVIVEFAVRLVSGLVHGTAGTAGFWDAAVSLVILLLEFVILPVLAGRKERQESLARKGNPS